MFTRETRHQPLTLRASDRNTNEPLVFSMMKRSTLCVALIALAVITTTTRAQNATPLERRAAEVCSQFRQTPENYDQLFAPSFLAKVPAVQLTAIFADYFSKLGKCVGAKQTQSLGPQAGRFDFNFEKGYAVPATLAVDEGEPNLANSLLLGLPIRSSATLEEIVSELKLLPGDTSLLITSLGKDGMKTIIAHNAERQMAIGSAFKLYILSELVREVGIRERKWTDVVALDGKLASLPSGTLQTWPSGSPVTLHTLASMMISVSDNTAADQLLATLTRERVENILPLTGHSKPELNQPFLSTLEMFKLKGEPTGKAAAAYLALDLKGRRAFLSDTVAKITREDTRPFWDLTPTYIDKIEWFASAADLCHVMDWLRQNTEGDKTARQILAINPGSGLNIPRDRWQYVGYKGGSEPGVLNLTYLLESTKGDWYAVSLGWNNKAAPLQNEKMFELLQQLLRTL
jgi:beta-lactamase class A